MRTSGLKMEGVTRLLLIWSFVIAIAPGTADAQVYRCDGPSGTSYQSRPCADASQQRRIENRLSVIEAGPMPSNPRSARPPAGSGSSVVPIERVEEREATHCEGLRRQLRSIDAAARQRSTERLKERRRSVRARMYDARCSEFSR